MRLFRKTVFVCILLIMSLLLGCNLSDAKNKLPASKPKDFNFVFKFGVEAKNQLDTFKGQFTKDMISIAEPSVTTDLKLTDKEMNAIYSEMKKIDILSYPENFAPKDNGISVPSSTYSLRIVFDGHEKIINWKAGSSKTKKAVQLNELAGKIYKMIISKDEYKKLPPPKALYDWISSVEYCEDNRGEIYEKAKITNRNWTNSISNFFSRNLSGFELL